MMTLLFAATTALCLLVLATIAVRTDSHSRTSDLDNAVSHRADGLARTLFYDAQGTLRLDSLSEDELARSAEMLAILQTSPNSGPQIRSAYPVPAALPGQGELEKIWQEVQHDQETVLVAAAAADGREYRWAAAPVWDEDSIGALVLVGADPAHSQADHQRLIQRLSLGCAALVLLAAVVGHLLSGRAMRPALRGLEQQEQFLAEAAHELRTPLATLRLVVEHGSGSPQRAPAALSEALGLIDRLGRLVTGLLARARVESGTQDVELTPLRLDQLVRQTIRELPDSTGITVTTEPVIVDGDPELLAQAVRNLVENALRHGRGTPVEVRVTATRVQVRDHGPGVPPQDRTRVFERRVTGAASTGTGLAIVAWVAGLHGGTARISQAPGGASVELLLPERAGR
ncbi:HAMP domain-containing histidine kinase [Nocardia sp. NEAU-G5]|uniref:histidine kinase n=2 Tax=Nocardia albiluteola TaxID=2842303 RepID=A0ABS6BEB3_9NOCA|nr:HAMP domain-containing histidine kinase [Nocardia albiluteola]